MSPPFMSPPLFCRLRPSQCDFWGYQCSVTCFQQPRQRQPEKSKKQQQIFVKTAIGFDNDFFGGWHYI